MKGLMFKPEMVEAIAQGRKTVTRRLDGLKEINREPEKYEPMPVITGATWMPALWCFYTEDSFNGIDVKPRYHPGEVVYLKEGWRLGWYRYKKDAEVTFKDDVRIAFPWNEWLEKHTQFGAGKLDGGDQWRSSMFLPEKFARTFLRIKDVRPERLQEITEEDAIKEGIQYWQEVDMFRDYSKPYDAAAWSRDPIYSYQTLWDSINKPPFDWDSNCWVWRYAFEKVEKSNA